MQIRSGQATVTTSDGTMVLFSTQQTPADAAALASGQEFKFEDEVLAYYTILNVISAAVPAKVQLTETYAGARTPGTYYPYNVTRDYTPVLGLKELSPGDVNIRDAFTDNMRLLDATWASGGTSTGGGGSIGLQVRTVSASAESITVAGAFPAGGAYPILATPNWNTAVSYRSSSRSTGSFVLDFSVRAPASGAEVTYTTGST